MPIRINAVPALRTETSSREESPFCSATLLTLAFTANSTAAPMARSTPVEVREDRASRLRCHITGPCWPIRVARRRAGSLDGHRGARNGDRPGLRPELHQLDAQPSSPDHRVLFGKPECLVRGLGAVE